MRTGSPGRPPDPNSKRSQLRAITVLPPVDDDAEIPDPPADLAPRVFDAWLTFWRSPLRRQVIDSDMVALHRLFDLYDRRERFVEAGMQEPVTSGSQGQQTLNPLLKEAAVLEHAILALEDRFGMSPFSRLKLQVKIGDASKSITEANARLGVTPDDNEAPEEIDLRRPAKRIPRAAV